MFDEEDFWTDRPRRKAKRRKSANVKKDVTVTGKVAPKKKTSSKSSKKKAKKKVKLPAGLTLKTVSKPDKRDPRSAVNKFFSSVASSDKIIWIGIDPGTSGAISFIHPDKGGEHTSIDIPTKTRTLATKTKKGNYKTRSGYDEEMIWQCFQFILPWRERVVVALERMYYQPTDTPLTAFSLGAAYHMWPLFFLSNQIKFETITPSAWKRTMGLLGQEKEVSRALAQKLFPSAPLLRTGDHNRAEAFLIADATRRRATKKKESK